MTDSRIQNYLDLIKTVQTSNDYCCCHTYGCGFSFGVMCDVFELSVKDLLLFHRIQEWIEKDIPAADELPIWPLELAEKHTNPECPIRRILKNTDFSWLTRNMDAH